MKGLKEKNKRKKDERKERRKEKRRNEASVRKRTLLQSQQNLNSFTTTVIAVKYVINNIWL